MHGGSGSDGLAAHERDAVLALADRYDMAHHGSSLAPHARALPDAFLDGFAAIGDVARVTDRLRAIAEHGRRPDRDDRGLARRRHGADPALRARVVDRGAAEAALGQAPRCAPTSALSQGVGASWIQATLVVSRFDRARLRLAEQLARAIAAPV
jgi:hypothetical protein